MKIMQSKPLMAACAVLLIASVAACGSTRASRGLSGAGIGGAAGAAGAAIIGAPVVGGAVIGGAAGAATGLLTDEGDLDLFD